MWNTSRDKIEDLKSNSFHPTIKFTVEISETEELHSWIRKFTKVLDSITNLFLTCECISIHKFQYTNFNPCHPPGVTKGFIKGEALRLLRTNSPQFSFSDRGMLLAQKNKTARKKTLPFGIPSALP